MATKEIFKTAIESIRDITSVQISFDPNASTNLTFISFVIAAKQQMLIDGCVICGKATPYRKRLTALPKENGLLRASYLLTQAIDNLGSGERSPLCSQHWAEYHYFRRRHWVQLSEGLPEENTLLTWLVRISGVTFRHSVVKIKEMIPKRKGSVPTVIRGDSIDVVQWRHRVSQGHLREIDWVDIFDYTDDDSIRVSFRTSPYELATWLDMRRPSGDDLSKRQRIMIISERRPNHIAPERMRVLLDRRAYLCEPFTNERIAALFPN
jgi:hypothetical protein